jgi:hypothetical protein
MSSVPLAAPSPCGRRLGSQQVPTCGTLFPASYPAVLEEPSHAERRVDQLWRGALKAPTFERRGGTER